MSHCYHFCKAVRTTNVLVTAVYFSSQLRIMKEPMKIPKAPQLYMHRIKITPLIRFLLVFCIIIAGTAVKPQVVKADVKPGWIVSCMYSHSLNDDPIVYPGQVGRAHLHDFSGANTTNA